MQMFIPCDQLKFAVCLEQLGSALSKPVLFYLRLLMFSKVCNVLKALRCVDDIVQVRSQGEYHTLDARV